MNVFLWILSIALFLAVWVLVIAVIAYLKGRRNAESTNLIINCAMLVLTIFSLVVAFAAFLDSKTSGDEQKKTLQASRDSLQDVVNALQSQTQLLRNAQDTLQSQLEVSRQQQTAMKATTMILEGTKKTLKSQLDIVTAQNKRELARLNKKPRITFGFGNISEEAFGHGVTVPVSVAQSDLTLTVTNTGDAALSSPSLTITTSPEMLISGKPPVLSLNRSVLQLSGTSIAQSLEPVSVAGSSYSFKFVLAVPDTVSQVKLTFSIYGSNMPIHQSSLLLLMDRLPIKR